MDEGGLLQEELDHQAPIQRPIARVYSVGDMHVIGTNTKGGDPVSPHNENCELEV